MKESIFKILRCPQCKEKLKLQIETKNIENVIDGSMVCSNCKKEYLISEGIPRMYIPDNEIIALSNDSRFPEFTITPKNLDKWIENSKNVRKTFFTNNKIFTKFLVGFGWFLFFFSIIGLILIYFHFAMINNTPLSTFYLFLGISVTFFIIDYIIYRESAKINYSDSVHTLKKLFNKQKLSEYNIRTSIKDNRRDFGNQIESQEKFTDYKGKIIAAILNKYNFKVKNVLNVGCGGEMHKSVSTSYFDKGCCMIGVDISEEYLKQFNKIFNADVIQANGMSLPFRSNSFDLINFTDIVEHLHNPLLGLSEVYRVLNKDGVIILTTNNRGFSFNCINPLVLVEKIVGLYYNNVLPSRNLLGQWMDFNFYHTEFSKKEITKLLNAAGLEILSLETHFPDKEKLTKIFKKFPALRFMCDEFIIIGKKHEKLI